MLSMKKRPDIRYSVGSDLAKMMGMEMMRRMKEEADLFTFQGEAPCLIFLDRRDDPVTPLLSQWTYQAMVHELLGIENNRVSMKQVPGIRKELVEVVLNPGQDMFFRGAMFLNFGELGQSVKQLVADFQKTNNNHARLDSIEDMQRFVDNYPEFRSMSGTVSKHVAIMSELSRLGKQMKTSYWRKCSYCCLFCLTHFVSSVCVRVVCLCVQWMLVNY